MHKDELPDRGRQASAEIAEAQNTDAEPNGADDAVTVGDLAGNDAAEPKTQHRHGEGERGGATRGGELALHRRQRDHNRPHADAAERADQHGYDQPYPGSARVRDESSRLRQRLRRISHNARTSAALPRGS